MENIAQFEIGANQINKFKRAMKKPQDCAINALELLGILNERNAGIARIVLGENKGLSLDEIEQIFNLVYPTHRWQFTIINKFFKLAKFTTQTLEEGHCVFTGYYKKDGGGHVFLIIKDKGKSIYIEPQIEAEKTFMCDLDEEECSNRLAKDKKLWVILTAKKK